MRNATKRPVLLGACLVAAAGLLVLAMFAVLREPTSLTDTSAAPSRGTEADGGSQSAAPTSVTGGAPESTPVAPRTELAGHGATLHALVVDRKGAPCANLEVELESSNRVRPRATSAADGTLVFHDLAKGTYLPHIVDHVILEPTRRIAIEPGREPSVVRIVCVPTPVLAGRVVDEQDQPVAGVWVIVDDPSGAEVAKVPSGSDGAFRIVHPRSFETDDVRLWVHSAGKWAIERKREARWGDVDIELRITPAPTGTLRVTAAENGQPVHDFRLWVELAAGARAEAPWVLDGWVPLKPHEDPEIAGLGMVPLRLSIVPVDTRFAPCEVDVPGGPACHDVRVALAGTATLKVRTEPAVAQATVEVLRVPADGAQWVRTPVWERGRATPFARGEVLLVAKGRTDERGHASVRGGTPGESVVVRVSIRGLTGQADTLLASASEVVVALAAAASLDVTTAVPPDRARQLVVERLTADGRLDPLGFGAWLVFGGKPDPELMQSFPKVKPGEDMHKSVQWMAAIHSDNKEALKKLLADPTLDDEARGRLERWRNRDMRRAHVDGLPAGRYRIAPLAFGQPASVTFADFELRAGEHRELILDLAPLSKLELNIPPPPGCKAQVILVDEETGEYMQPRAGRARAIASADDGRRWLSRDVFTIPAHGVVNWTPDFVPMRVTLRLRATDGAPIAKRAVSRVRADDVTAGWHGQPMGLTDAAGEIELAGQVGAFKLRVEEVASALGPFAADPRRPEQTIDIEVPAR